jgi:hypothetical protein
MYLFTKKGGILLSFLFLFTAIAFGQGSTTASLNGSVVDQDGNPLPGANIIALHQPTGTQYGTTSRLDGNFSIMGLRVGGPYEITVSFVGYQSQKQENVTLELSQNLKIDFILPSEDIELSNNYCICRKKCYIK